MANGSAALHLVPTPESKDASVGKPIEVALGTAVAAAVITFYQAAIAQQQSGLLPPAIKDAGAARIAALALLQLDHAGGDIDFVTRAHRDGKRELHRLFSANVFRQHAPGQVDAVLDMAIDSVFEIVSKVVQTERSFRMAWAN